MAKSPIGTHRCRNRHQIVRVSFFHPVFGDAARQFTGYAYLGSFGLSLYGLGSRFQEEKSDKGKNHDDDDNGYQSDGVEEGQHVHQGDTLVRISSPDAEAKLMQASAMESVYKATNEKVDKGARSEIIQAAYDMWQQAIAGLEIAKKSFDRMEALYLKGVVSAQKRDEAEAQYKAMVATESAARSQYEMARNGAQIEDKEAAAAMVRAAQGSVDQVKSVLADSYLTAPIDGEISEIFPHVSELVGTGAPISEL